MGPLLGRFEFDLAGRTALRYCLVVLFVLFLLIARRIVHSPFGCRCRRSATTGCAPPPSASDVNLRLAAVYTLAAAMAGAAGALLAQTTGFASLDVLDFHRWPTCCWCW